jgi:hypothetical protein
MVCWKANLVFYYCVKNEGAYHIYLSLIYIVTYLQLLTVLDHNVKRVR